MNPRLRIVFMGTPELACASLDALWNVPRFELIAVVTQPDRPKGRDLRLTSSPVKLLALSHKLPVLQPARARDEDFIANLRQLAPDLIAVTAFGQILPPAVLELPRFGCLNVHTSLLPKYRGAAPIQWAILNGEQETGITIMKMEAGLDTGPILAQNTTPILKDDDAQTMEERLAHLGAQLLTQTIPDYISGRIQPTPQRSEGASHARKIVREDGRLDWARPAHALWNQVRGLVPWPGAWTRLPGRNPELLKIWKAEPCEGRGTPGAITAAHAELVVACGEGALRVLSLQREGARRLTPQQFLAGCPLRAGERFGSAP